MSVVKQKVTKSRNVEAFSRSGEKVCDADGTAGLPGNVAVDRQRGEGHLL